tara:strand:- start:17671 stop:18519 length:849 start_codon:yes stop_codon:yes gene_type:complete
MEKELSLEKLLKDIILFFIKNKVLIFSITIFGIICVILFQKFKPAYFSTTAIATSGMSAYERFEDDDVLNQITAITIINNLQIDVRKEDYISLSKKLDVSEEVASSIKYIEAEQIYREDEEERLHNTPKFSINLLIRNNLLIPEIQEGIINYFNSNEYIQNYRNIFNYTNDEIISVINQEISDLKDLRIREDATIDLSTNTILSSRNSMEIQNQIVDLTQKRSIILTNNNMFKPISFVEDFSVSTVEEREVLVWGTAIGFLSFILSIIISLVLEVKRKLVKE